MTATANDPQNPGADSSKCLVVLIGGGHCAGKTTVARTIESRLKELYAGTDKLKVSQIDLNSYLRDDRVDPEGFARHTRVILPSLFDFDKLFATLDELENTSEGNHIIIVHGLYVLYDKRLRSRAAIKAFVDSDADIRLCRWIRRDIPDQPEKLPMLLDTYSRVEMNEFVLPTKEFADVILPKGSDATGLELIVGGVQDKVELLMGHQPVSRAGDPVIDVAGITGMNFKGEVFDDQISQFYDAV